jgi:hypothetical protein
MALTPKQQYDIDMSVTGKQNPVGGYLTALMQGTVGSVGGKTYAKGFDATALNALIAATATTTAPQTASATIGTATVVTVTGIAVKPVFWHAINASGDALPNIQSMSYSGTTVTFTVASTIASQTYQIQFI